MENIRIDPSLRDLIPPLTGDEYAQLKENIKEFGCRDPLTVWATWDDSWFADLFCSCWQGDVDKDDLILKGVDLCCPTCEEPIVYGDKADLLLLDGHNRYEICKDVGCDFDVVALECPPDWTLDDAKVWIIDNQAGRRNLPAIDRIALARQKKQIVAKRAKENQAHGSTAPGKTLLSNWTKASESIDTRKVLAKDAKVSFGTFARADKVLSAVERGELPERTLTDIREGKSSIHHEYKRVKAKERKEEQERVERERLSLVVDKPKLWKMTEAQEAVSCKAVITDPPYGILNEEWEPENLEQFTRDWAARWAASGADLFLIFWSQRHLWNGRRWFDESLPNYEFQQLLVWHYPNNKSPQSRKGFKQTWEPIFFYRRKDSTRSIRLSGSEWGGDLHDFDCHVAAVPQSNFNGAERKQHPAQKPVAVMRWLVGATTKPGELVCDPFAGSGTTGIAAVQLGRRFLGVELSAEYRAIAARRLAAYG